MMRALFSGDMPQLVLFDLDGTLVDSVPDLAQAVDKMLCALDRPVAGLEKVRTWVGNGAAMLVKRALADDLHPSDEEDHQYRRAYNLFLNYYAQATADQSELYPGVRECLETLAVSGVRMGLVTNKPMQFTRSMLEGLQLDSYFEVVFGGDSFPEKKPHPRPLREAMVACGVEPDVTLMVGDSVSDVRAARAAGCPVVCVPYGYNHGSPISESLPDLIVETLDQMI